jgi:signal peptidase II
MKPKKPATPRRAAPDRATAVSAAKRRRRLAIKWSVLAVVTGACVALGLWTTHLAEQRLVIGEVHKILPFLSLQRSANSGVAFGLLGGRLPIILAANAVAVIVVLVYVFMDRRAVVAGISGGLIVGGSLGNIIQRLTGDGHVTDFIKFPHWPNFNMPDVFIVLGIAAVFLGLIVEAILLLRAGHKAPASR